MLMVFWILFMVIPDNRISNNGVSAKILFLKSKGNIVLSQTKSYSIGSNKRLFSWDEYADPIDVSNLHSGNFFVCNQDVVATYNNPKTQKRILLMRKRL